MAEPRVGLPPIPVLPDEQLDAWERAHREAAAAVESLEPDLGHMVRRWSVGNLVVALAGRSPSVSGMRHPMLLPAPRAFLSEADRARIAGTAAAFTHVDVRISLVTSGVEPDILRPETPFVLHALAESGQTGNEETNPGIVRTKVAGWAGSPTPYRHPPADMVRPILDLLVQTAATMPAPPPVVAAWTALTWMSVHPWVDGNGRTARLLYLMLSGPSLPLELDYGIVEQFTFHRRKYVDALRAGEWITDAYDPDRIDPLPFTEAATTWSTAGAALLRARAQILERADSNLRSARPDLVPDERALALWVALERHAPADAFSTAAAASDPHVHLPVVELESLCTKGVIGRRTLPPSRRPPRSAPQLGYVAEREAVGAIVTAVEAARG